MNKQNIHNAEMVAAGKAQKKMKPVSQYQPDKLFQLIQEGKTAQEICKILNIQHLQVLKAHVQKLSFQKKMFIEVPGLYLKIEKQCWVNKNGEIRFTMKNIDFKGMELIPNLTEFSVRVDGDKIILQKLSPNQKQEKKAENIGEPANTENKE